MSPMSEFRLIHAADVHLDTTFRTRSVALRARLAVAVREAFSALVDLCLDEAVHALVLAGDVFDDDRLTFETESFLLGELRRLDEGGVTTVAVTGNHDPGLAGGRMRRLRWPASFHLLADRKPRTVRVTEHRGRMVGRITGCGYEVRDETANLAATFPQPRGGVPEVAVLHTLVTGAATAESHARYAPCTRADLAATRYDYWALGHVHRTQCVLEEPCAWYPGNLQGRHFGETGPRGALSVSVAPGRARAVFHELAPLRFEDLGDVDITGATAFDHVVAALAQSAPSTDRELIIRARLVGATPLARALRRGGGLDDAARAVLAETGWLDVDLACAVTAPHDVAALRRRDDPLGMALAVIEEMRRDDEALDRIAPTAFADLGETTRAEHVWELLDDVEGDVVAEFSEEDGA